VLSQETASNCGFDLIGENPDTPDFYVEILGVGGQVENIPGFYLNTLTIPAIGGALNFTNVPVIVYDLIDPADGEGTVPGIIGMNLFSDRDLVINGGTSTPAVGIGPLIRSWKSASGGTWSDATKWNNGVPNNASGNVPVAFFDAISTAQTVTVGSDVTVGGLSFDNTARYTLDGPGRITLRHSPSPPPEPQAVAPVHLWVGRGSHTINAPMTLATNTIITVQQSAGVLTLSNDVTVNAGVGITKAGAGTVEMKNVRADSLAVNGGKVTVLTNGANAAASVVKSLSVSSGRIDLRNNKLIARGPANGGTSTVFGIESLVASGRNGGTWNGDGVVTSMSDAGVGIQKTTLAVAAAGDVGKSTFAGFSVASTDVLVMYTYAGDANLSGNVDADDYFRIDRGYARGDDGFTNGDFDYSGAIDGDDFFLIDSSFSNQGSPISSGVTAVPEPAGLSLLVGGLLLACRRRRV
jgi:hypothetical protein